MTTTPALNDDLLQRLTGENPDRVTPADRLRLYGTDPETFVFDSGDAWEAVELLEAAASALEALSKEIEALRSVLEPSAETKAAYSGEFYELVEIINPNFDEDDENEPYTLVQQVPVSWTTIKEIMAAIRARTALKGA